MGFLLCVKEILLSLTGLNEQCRERTLPLMLQYADFTTIITECCHFLPVIGDAFVRERWEATSAFSYDFPLHATYATERHDGK